MTQYALWSGNVAPYKKLRNATQRAAKQLRQQYYNRKIKQLRSSDPRKWWQSVKRFIGTDQAERSEVSNLATQLNYDEDCALASDINKFLAGVASDLNPLQDDFCDQFVCDCDSCAKYTIEPWQVEIKLS